MRLHSDDVSRRTVLLAFTGVVVLLSVVAAVELGRDRIVRIAGVAAVVIGVLWLGAAFLMRHPRIANALQTASVIAFVCMSVAVLVLADHPVVRRGLSITIGAVVTALSVLAESAQTVPGLLVIIAVILFCILRQRSPG